MILSLSDLLERLRCSLRDVVLPEVDSDHARSQLASVMDALDKLERLAVWSPDVLRAQLAAFDEGHAEIAARATDAGFSPAEPFGEVEPLSVAPTQAELEARLAQSERRLEKTIDWLFEQGHRMPRALRDELDARLCTALRTALVVERRLVTRADFTAMTATRSTAS